jgi:hypothetical protein
VIFKIPRPILKGSHQVPDLGETFQYQCDTWNSEWLGDTFNVEYPRALQQEPQHHEGPKLELLKVEEAVIGIVHIFCSHKVEILICTVVGTFTSRCLAKARFASANTDA